MKIKGKIKEVVFECESEAQALELFNSYKKQNFHLVSKKVLDPEANSMVIKLIRFADTKPADNLDTVWENFVVKMKELGFSSKYITLVLENIKAKNEFWKTHPSDHLHDAIFSITKFMPAYELSQRLCLIAKPESMQSFWCSLQKSLKYYIKEKGFFVVAPEDMLKDIKDLSVSSKISVHSYDPSDLSLNKLNQTLNGESGLWLLPPSVALSYGSDFLKGVCAAFDFSLLMDADLELEPFKSFYDTPCSLVAEYNKKHSGLFKALEKSYFHQLPISFFWDGDVLGEMQNPEKQTLAALESAFKDEGNRVATVA